MSNRRGRDDSAQLLAEGPQAVREALTAGLIRTLFVTEAAADRHQDLLGGDRVLLVDEAQLASLTDTVTPQGMVAVCDQPRATLDDVLAASPRLVVICAEVRDPGNAGTVIRCADAFGADAVILTHGSVELANPKTVRASVGSVFHLPIVTGVGIADAVSSVQAAGLRVLAADGAGERTLDVLARVGDLDGPTAWLMGNEAWGLPADVAALADEVVRVPMWGQAESLNLSTAAAVCLYATAEAQRRQT
ncbi:MAG TPA: RNA methyltransferase [Propionibacteriaceae bacterium]|nr:RNA methyltransferase [Propionibacteriaceae bacterium]HPZ48357.1 RNA methyltransferase [Propionibacteriaceae bacterium]HQE31008.1 RNA methyltransferase [Propionibacteriaceae bacterium]